MTDSNKKSASNLVLRVMTALVLFPLALLLIWWPGRIPFMICILIVCALASKEYYAIARAAGAAVESVAGTVLGLVMVAMVFMFQIEQSFYLHLLLLLFMVPLIHLFRRNYSLTGLGATLLGVVYVGLLPALLAWLYFRSVSGPGAVTLLVLAIVFSDSGAYFVGRFLGRHKLWPSVSPKKTREGAVGGLLAAVLAMGLLWWLENTFLASWMEGRFSLQVFNSLGHYLVAGFLLALVGQFGDLVESFMKRDAGVKDSGTLLPGHGGILDRCDGILFGIPVLVYLLYLL